MADTATATITRRSRPAWEERLAGAHHRHPEVLYGAEEFHTILADYDLLGRLYRDVLRVGYDAPTRRGQRSPLEWNDGRARMRAITAERRGQATSKAFPDAFAELGEGRSVRELAEHVGWTKTKTHRLLDGSTPPSILDLEHVAAVFDKPPTFFTEYRVHLICSTLAENLVASPERSVDILIRLGVHPEVDDL